MIDLSDNGERTEIERIINNEIRIINENPSVIKANSCAACHVLYTVANKMKISEQDAADLLSEVLLENIPLNDQFIELVEDVHMKQRMMGVTFVLKSRDAKDKYINSQFKNTLNELLGDASCYGARSLLEANYLPDSSRARSKFRHRLSCCNRRIILLYEKERY